MKTFILVFLTTVNIILLLGLLIKIIIQYIELRHLANTNVNKIYNANIVKQERCYGNDFYLADMNGCVPISLMVALDIDYIKAYDLAQYYLHRNYQDGVMWLDLYAFFNSEAIIYGHKFKPQDAERKDWYGKLKKMLNMDNHYLLGDFIDKEGTYLIGTKGHMLCVKDGIVYDADTTMFDEPVNMVVKVEKVLN
jgi:hypothetical protein